MPQQISKTIGVMLIDEEVEAWRILEAYLIKKDRIESPMPNPPKITSKRMLRELLRLAAEHLSAEIGPKVAASLASPPTIPQFLMNRAAAQRNTKPASKARGRKPGEKPKPVPAAKSARRVYWDRPYQHGTGDAG